MESGVPWACLVAPRARIYQAPWSGRVSPGTALAPATYLNYWRAWRRGARQGRIAGDPRRLSGVAVVDAEGRLRWRYAARTIGDYPPIARVLAEVQRLAWSGRPDA